MRRVPLLAQVLIAIALGEVVGVLAGPRAAVLGRFALVFVALLKLFATPLVFFAIVDTFATTRLPLKRALVLLPVSTVNALVAAGIALSLAHLLPLGRFVDLPKLRALVGPPPKPGPDFVPFSLLWVVAAALVFGVLLRVLRVDELGRPANKVGRAVHSIFEFLMRALGVIVRAVPLAAFGIMARVVGSSGFAIFPVLGLFVLIVALGIFIHVFGWYAILLRVVARRTPGRFFRMGSDALGTALAAGSSLATLPVTLRTLEGPMEVSSESARLAAVVGTNLNHDGIVLYEAAAALFVAQLYGVDTTLMQQLKVVGLSIAAAVGIAGVPEAGLLTLTLVLRGAGLPVGAVPLLLPVDWMLGRLRAACNVASDMVVANILDRFTSSRRASPDRTIAAARAR